MRRLLALLGLLVALASPAGAVPQGGSGELPSPFDGTGGGLAGKLLVASPRMPANFFAGTVILLGRHDDQGAFGLVVNRRAGTLEGKDKDADAPPLPWPLQIGGPVEPRLLFLLMTAETAPPSGLRVGGFALANPEPYLAGGEGAPAPPRKAMLLMGYAGWAAGQLEEEIRRGDWLVVDADEHLVFDGSDADKWRHALGRRGEDL
ncbi:MAG: YqgE/AlgH family protein [Actinomycetota bacterium]